MPTYVVQFTLVDAYQRLARKEFETIALADEAAALAAAAGLATDLGNLTELEILAYTVGQRIVYTDSVTAGANRDEGVTFTIRKEDNYNAALKVPGPINAIFDADGSVDLANSAVVAFVGNFFAGGGEFVFSDGEQGTLLVKGVLDK